VPDGGKDDDRDDESDNEGEKIGNEVLRCWSPFENIDEGGSECIVARCEV
jgi:hypothetical protein